LADIRWVHKGETPELSVPGPEAVSVVFEVSVIVLSC
jgi:hypothetical protein